MGMAKSGSMAAGLRQIPAGVWALGFVSMFMDISSEMIHALLPIYMVGALGASALDVGFIEGIAEATAAITKIFSGTLSDWLGRRKELAALGYGLAAFTKPVFPLAPSLPWLVGARFVDRVGKGIRGAPRDALVADIAPPEMRGAAFGLRQSLDTVGAFAGPLIAILLMLATANNFAAVFWIAVLPAFISFFLIAFVVQEPDRPAGLRKVNSPLSKAELARLGPRYCRVVAIASLFTLARFSEAFLILRAQSVGLPIALVPAVMVLMNAVYALSAYPAGVVSDRIDRNTVLIAGLVLLILADFGLAFSGGVIGRCGRRRLVGAAYGADARLARNAGRRYCARRTSRHGVWHVQPCDGACAACGERDRGRAVGHRRPEGHIPCGRRLRRAYPSPLLSGLGRRLAPGRHSGAVAVSSHARSSPWSDGASSRRTRA